MGGDTVLKLPEHFSKLLSSSGDGTAPSAQVHSGHQQWNKNMIPMCLKAACLWVPDGLSFSESEGQLVFSHIIFRAGVITGNCFFKWLGLSDTLCPPTSSFLCRDHWCTVCGLGSLIVKYSGSSS